MFFWISGMEVSYLCTYLLYHTYFITFAHGTLIVLEPTTIAIDISTRFWWPDYTWILKPKGKSHFDLSLSKVTQYSILLLVHSRSNLLMYIWHFFAHGILLRSIFLLLAKQDLKIDLDLDDGCFKRSRSESNFCQFQIPTFS